MPLFWLLLIFLAVIAGLVLFVLVFGSRIRVGGHSPSKDRYSLGIAERWYAASHDAQAVQGFTIAVELGTKEGDTAPSALKPALVAALKRVVAAHEGLQCTYTHSDNHTRPVPDRLYRVNWKPEAFDSAVEEKQVESKEAWLKEVEDANTTPFRLPATPSLEDPSSFDLLLRLKALRCPQGAVVLLFTFHHLIADGAAAAHLVAYALQALEEECSTAGASLTSTAKGDGTTFELGPPLEDTMDVRATLKDVVVAVVKDRFPRLFPQHCYLGPAAPAVPPSQRHNVSLAVDIAGSKTDKLVEACRGEGTSINFLLMACLQIASAAVIQHRHNRINLSGSDDEGTAKHSPDPALADAYQQYIAGHLPLQTSFARNSRSLNSSPKAPLSGLRAILCGYEMQCSLGPRTTVWSLAKAMYSQGLRIMRKQGASWGLLQFLSGSYRSFFQRHVSKPPNGRDAFSGISNLGRVPVPPAVGPLLVKRLYFAMNKAAEGPLVMCSAVTATALPGPFSTHQAATTWPPDTPTSLDKASTLGLTLVLAAPEPLMTAEELRVYRRAVEIALTNPTANASRIVALANQKA